MGFSTSRNAIAPFIAVSIALVSVSAFSFAQSFTSSTVGISSGINPRGIESGDLNGDGNLDIVTTNYGSDDATVLLGNGAGVFTPTIVGFATPFGTQDGSFVLIDTNGDNILDIVAPTFDSPGMGIMLGDGLGGFGAPVGISTPTTLKGVLAGDFTSDGLSDLLGSSYASDAFELVVASGGGAFGWSSSISYATPFGTNLGYFAISDFNKDGKLDFASATFYTDGFGVLLGNGLGGFAAPTLFPVGTGTTQGLAVGDINGDGKPDIALMDTSATVGKKVYLFVGDGLGGFAAGPTASVATGTLPFGVALGDVTGDGFADVIETEDGIDQVRVFPGDGAGNFGSSVVAACGADAERLTIGDVNGDGAMDIATANNASSTVSMLLNNALAPTGISAYGTGTGGCTADMGMSTNGQAFINTPGFRITCTNAPTSTLGL